MPTSTDQIRQKIAAFVTEIETLTRQAALEAVQAALGGVAAPARAARPSAPSAPRKPAPRAKGGKRTPEQVAADAEKILAFVKSNAGCSAEQIQAGLGLSKKDIALPLLRLREEKRVKITGQKRGTKYFAGGAGAPTAATPAKRAAPKAKPVAAKKRKPMSPEQRKALLERLAKARAARTAKLAKAR
ncbi:MAG: hypothetical protein L6Q99_16065 [Planctomycetes bacterium]|nr:hypothetical protein [Planctomycetota bacterium]